MSAAGWRAGGATPVFGRREAGENYRARRAAYLVVLNDAGDVAAVSDGGRHFLPGGGARAGEIPQQTVAREVREELACTVEIGVDLGAAVQFFAAREARFRMIARFFAGRLGGPTGTRPEHALCWIPVNAQSFCHPCFAWAVGRALGAAARSAP